MLQLLSNLTTLSNFFSRAFFVGAILPTLMFISINGLILFVWNWPFHDWARRELFDNTLLGQTIAWIILFFLVWLASYVVAALTPLWTRTLEGKNWDWWWLGGLREEGIEKHLERYDDLDRQINASVKIYTTLPNERSRWDLNIREAARACSGQPTNSSTRLKTDIMLSTLQRTQRSPMLLPGDFLKLPTFVQKLRSPDDKVSAYLQNKLPANLLQELADTQHTAIPMSLPGKLAHALNLLICRESIYNAERFEGIKLRWETKKLNKQNPAKETLMRLNRLLLEDAYPGEIAPLDDGQVDVDQIDQLVKMYCAEIRETNNSPQLSRYAGDITLLIDKTYRRALRVHSRLATERNLEFGNREDIAPTRFGNIGMSAEAFAMRSYRCNLGLVGSALRRAIAKEADTSAILENTKSQLDLLVACFWLSLFTGLGWAVAFAISGEPWGAILSATGGPAICWGIWYGAAVEQYRLLQSLLISAMNSPLRFQVLADLHVGLPTDILEERELWKTINLAVGFGEHHPLRYQYPNPKT